MATEQRNDSNNAARGGSGNFANDREKASEAGRKGGEHSHQGRTDGSAQGQGDSSSGGQRAEDSSSDQEETSSSGKQPGGSGNFANDPEKASEVGRKGGENSHGGR